MINNFKKLGIPYVYFEMIELENLNKLYNILDLYIVSSRIEGGPQAILESAITKTPIVSTDVGVASEILSSKSIYEINSFNNSEPDIEFAYKNALDFTIPKGMVKFREMFGSVYEN